jgi:NitT/TauT family transport system substrate-binding protein
MKLSIWIALLAGLTFMTACSPPPPEPLRIVSSPWPGYEPLYLARDLGYLKDSAVRISELPSANISFEAFKNGSGDVATLTLDEVVILLAEGRKLRLLLVMDVSNGADAVVARNDIKSLAGLKGKRLAMENIPLGVYILNRMLEAAHLKATDIDIVPLPEDKHEDAYLRGKIDAAITMEPYKSKLVKAGGHVLFDSSQIPNEIFDLVVVREEVYQKRRDDLCHLARQWFRTLDYIHANPQEAATRMGKRQGVDAETFLASMNGMTVPDRKENRLLLGGSSPALLAPARRLAEIMRREHMIAGPVEFAASIDPGFAACLQ